MSKRPLPQKTTRIVPEGILSRSAKIMHQLLVGVSSVAIVAGASVAGVASAAPAHAVGLSSPFSLGVDQSGYDSTIGTYGKLGFSNYGLGARDVDLYTYWGAPGGDVWFGVEDTSTKVWYGGWAYADTDGRVTQTITNIPGSSCGKTFVADASDWGEPGAPAAAEHSFVMDCSPQITAKSNGAIKGDGFTAGTSVPVFVNGAYAKSVLASKYQLHKSPAPPTTAGLINTGPMNVPACVGVSAWDGVKQQIATTRSAGCVS
jgi:hypothetical protein